MLKMLNTPFNGEFFHIVKFLPYWIDRFKLIIIFFYILDLASFSNRLDPDPQLGSKLEMSSVLKDKISS